MHNYPARTTTFVDLKPWRAALVALLWMVFSVPNWAAAEEDAFGTGDGSDGAFTAGAGSVVNVYRRLTANIAVGGSSVSVNSGAGFSAGDLVMLWHVQGNDPIASLSNQSTMNLDSAADGLGKWELTRLSAVSGNTLTARRPFLNSFPVSRTQVIRVPEFTTVTVASGRSIVASSWNGTTGGIVAFLATGTVTVNGSINVSERGFRGGPAVIGTAQLGCTSLSQPGPNGGRRGEGTMFGSFAASETGRGIRTNGGGGGVCLNSGAGGGGHIGRGGIGAVSWHFDGKRPVGGLGGAALSYSPSIRMTIGGGGGAGHTDANPNASGEPGGGAIWLRSASFAGSGSLVSNGGSAPNAQGEGAGGGGAGGSIHVQVATSMSCGSATARGGAGGNAEAAPGTSFYHGPGGGGGGGRIHISAASRSCSISISGGSAGIIVGTSVTNGAASGGNGSFTAGSALDIDQDNDGILDVDEVATDSDGDGTPDYQDADDDGDGIPTLTEGDAGTDSDGDASASL